jgi:PAS domain S-box-containing protein
MNRILLLLHHYENRTLLANWLTNHYQVVLPETLPGLQQAIKSAAAGMDVRSLDLHSAFDLCILDGQAFSVASHWIPACKAAADPVFLPFLLVTTRPNISTATRKIWQSVDELLPCPIDKAELQIRLEVLLRTRCLSLDLQQRNLELKTATAQLEQEIRQSEQARQALQKSEAKFRTLLESAPDPIVIVDRHGMIVLVNGQAEQKFGYFREELQGRMLEVLLPERFRSAHSQHRQRYQSHNPTVRRMGERLDLWARRKDGSEFPVDVSLSPIETAGESFTTAIIRDITLQKQAEQEIRQALEAEQELNAMKSRFVSMVSHEFRNPLTSILLTCHMLEQGDESLPLEKKQDYFQRIKHIVRHMNDLLEDVLFIGRSDSGKSELNLAPMNLSLFCQELVADLQLQVGEQHTIEFTETWCSEEPAQSASVQSELVEVDDRLLRHILTNLLSNAMKYSPSGKSVSFVVDSSPEKVTFQIRDEGIGIPPDDQVRLFEAFHRAGNVGKIPGTGLGLSIVKRCVDLHGGTIAVLSDVGMGTTFTVTIPLGGRQKAEGKGQEEPAS